MSVVVQFGKSYASFADGQWTGSDLSIQQVLNGSLRRNPVPPGHPDPDSYALQKAKDRLPTLNVIRIGPEKKKSVTLMKVLRFLFGFEDSL